MFPAPPCCVLSLQTIWFSFPFLAMFLIDSTDSFSLVFLRDFLIDWHILLCSNRYVGDDLGNLVTNWNHLLGCQSFTPFFGRIYAFNTALYIVVACRERRASCTGGLTQPPTNGWKARGGGPSNLVVATIMQQTARDGHQVQWISMISIVSL